MLYQTINPTTSELIKTYPEHTDQQVEEALAAAHKLYKSEWSQGPIQPRLAVLRKFADLVDARAEELARSPRSKWAKLIGESREEVGIIAVIARYYADNAERFLAPTPIQTGLGDAWIEHHPLGVLVAVEP